ncbi:MAG: VOC family protein [Gammaproteobacteria bacterium]
MQIIGIDHIQIAIPFGGENLGRAFYGELLGLTEISKPEDLAANGGVWFELGDLQLHLGIDPEFKPAKKAHPGLIVSDLDSLAAKLKAQGYEITEAAPVEEMSRFFTADPFGNRLEFLEPLTS